MADHIGKLLARWMEETDFPAEEIRLPDIAVDRDSVRALLISEVAPQNPADDFYGSNRPPAYLTTAIPLFRQAGVEAEDSRQLLDRGIYLTNAVKTPKAEYAIPPTTILAQMPLLEQEISLFPNVRVIMLLGDVAKRSFNAMARKQTKKAVIPAGSTYKIRSESFYFGEIRVFPSYIITGGNILIEKSKCTMIIDDIRRMMEILEG